MKGFAVAFLALLMTGCAVIQKFPVNVTPIGITWTPPTLPLMTATNVFNARDKVAHPIPGRPIFARLMADLTQQPYLSIYYTNLDNICLVTWVNAAPTDAGGGSGSITISQYTGPGVALVAHGLTDDTNALFVEVSHDLSNPTNWVAWPQPGFQLTMLATNNTSCFPLDTNNAATFFRGRCGVVTY